jgi:hypothetical protein
MPAPVNRIAANVEGRIGVADHGAGAGGIGDEAAAGLSVGDGAGIGVAGNKIQQAGGGGSKGRAIGVVVHGEVLRVVPQRGHGIAVVVVHDAVDAQTAGAGVIAAEGKRRAVLEPCAGEAVHQAVVSGKLLIAIHVVLVAGDRPAAVDAHRIRDVWIGRQQAGGF